jgi:hypothetical protein
MNYFWFWYSGLGLLSSSAFVYILKGVDKNPPLSTWRYALSAYSLIWLCPLLLLFLLLFVLDPEKMLAALAMELEKPRLKKSLFERLPFYGYSFTSLNRMHLEYL